MAAGLIAATAVNALAQPLTGCRMHTPDTAPTQTVGTEKEDHPCHGHGDEAAVTSAQDSASGEHGQHCMHAGSCTCCATGLCGGAHSALSIGSLFAATYDAGAGKVPHVPLTDAPRTVYHDPPLRPPAETTL